MQNEGLDIAPMPYSAKASRAHRWRWCNEDEEIACITAAKVMELIPDMKSSLRSFILSSYFRAGYDRVLYIICKYKTHADLLNKGVPEIQEMLLKKYQWYGEIKAITEKERQKWMEKEFG